MVASKSRKSSQLSFDFDKAKSPKKSQKVKSKKAAAPSAKAKVKSKKTLAPESKPKVKTAKRSRGATAESMAAKQRDISISEFFAKNRHLLGFDNPRKALLTTVKEGVDNALDACEEAHILPDITVSISPVANTENKYVLTIKDNGPGIVKQQVPNIFARLLYGSKFHSLKMSRGQQGIGISAAGMYGLITTGEPVQIISRTKPKKPAHHYHVQIDTARNKPHVVLDEDCEFDLPTGTQVTITLAGRYQKGRQSVDEYISQTAMANPHATIVYNALDGNAYEYPRQTKERPFDPVEIMPHPYGVELGVLYKMARESSSKQLSVFLQKDFSRVSVKVAGDICKKAKLKRSLRTSQFTIKDADALHKAINETKIRAPSANCIGPIGEKSLHEGIKRIVDADFYATCTRKPSVYRGNPFLIETALAYGFKNETSDNGDEKEPLMQLIRIANRVPLLYQQSAGAIYKAVIETNWRNYALAQSRGALPTGRVVLMVHMASVWVPFTSESKEAVAHYPEIIKEIKLAVQECGRKLGIYMRKQKRIKAELIKRSYIETYLPHIGEALRDILSLKQKQVDTVVTRLKDVLGKSRKM